MRISESIGLEDLVNFEELPEVETLFFEGLLQALKAAWTLVHYDLC